MRDRTANGASTLSEAYQTSIAFFAEVVSAGTGAVFRVGVGVFAHLVGIEGVATAGPGGARADTAGRAGAADRAALFHGLEVAGDGGGGGGEVRRGMTSRSRRGYPLQAREAGDAIGAFGLEGGGRRG